MKSSKKLLSVMILLALILANVGVNPVISKAATLKVPGNYKGTVLLLIN